MSIHAKKGPLYDGCVMLHKDGTLMCRTSLKVARWYVKRGLAAWVNEEGGQFQLNFDSKGKGKSHLPFYTVGLENKCVVCGCKENLNKHHVVPRLFRRHFPKHLKARNSHDVLALCVDHHTVYETHSNQLKQELAQTYQICPRTVSNVNRMIYRKIMNARHILETNRQLPLSAKLRLTEIAQQQLPELIDEQVPDLGQLIIQRLSDKELIDFIVMWRKHFVNTMTPRFLPPYWSIHHTEREFSKEQEIV